MISLSNIQTKFCFSSSPQAKMKEKMAETRRKAELVRQNKEKMQAEGCELNQTTESA